METTDETRYCDEGCGYRLVPEYHDGETTCGACVDIRDEYERTNVPAYAVESLSEYESMSIDAGYVRHAADRYLGEADTQREWAERYAEECGLLSGLDEDLRYYWDAEAWLSDACLSGDLTVVDVAHGVAVFSN